MAEVKRISEDRSDWQRWIQQGYPDSWKGKKGLEEEEEEEEEEEFL